MVTTREARKLVKARYGSHPFFLKAYCEGSRRVCDFLETIVTADLANNEKEAKFWRAELASLIPEFTDSI